MIDLRRRLDEIIAEHTGQDVEKVRADTERDYFMSSERPGVRHHRQGDLASTSQGDA